ncbi:MAG: hypothetical protein H0W46_07950 [Acidimicrobiia bacterium]|nr:hypothetical protein [Acidimicrobiia bacterium]
MLATLGGCADDEAAPLRPLVAEIGAAVEAVETELGRAQQYFEINATPQFVNLFVAVDDATAVVAYLYVDGELGPPRPPEGADGATFAATALTFDPDLVLGGIDDDLPDSDVVVFSVVGGPDGAVRYGAVVESGEGGQLDVTLDAAGTVRAVDPL